MYIVDTKKLWFLEFFEVSCLASSNSRHTLLRQQKIVNEFSQNFSFRQVSVPFTMHYIVIKSTIDAEAGNQMETSLKSDFHLIQRQHKAIYALMS